MNIFIPMKPVSKERPRFTRDGHVYTPKKTRDAESFIREFFVLSCREYQCFRKEIPISVVVTFLFKKPKSQKNPFPMSGDIDNYQKLLFDSLNGFLWADDKQIVSVFAMKRYLNKESMYEGISLHVRIANDL